MTYGGPVLAHPETSCLCCSNLSIQANTITLPQPFPPAGCFLRPSAYCRLKPIMWLTLLFLGTAALFLAMTSITLFHLQWARRLPALSELDTADAYDDANDSR